MKPDVSTLSRAKEFVVKLLTRSRYNFLRLDRNQQAPNVRILSSGVYAYSETLPLSSQSYTIFGVRKDRQDKLDFHQFRTDIAQTLQLPKLSGFTQIIGDSIPYSEKGTQFCRSYISDVVSKEIVQGFLLYGFTGHEQENGRLADKDHLVSEWVDQDAARSQRVIANVVDKHTIDAIESWGCTISQSVRNFILVYTEGAEPSARFGDDAPLDKLTNRKTICLSGRVQSLVQCLNTLENDVEVVAISQINDPHNYKNFDKATHKLFLSASEFLNFLKNKIASSHDSIPSMIQSWINEYCESHELYDATAPDASTKQNLWVLANQLLVEKAVYKKFPLLHTYDAVPPPYLVLTDLGGDIDDALTLLWLVHSHKTKSTPLPLAIITSHIESEEKARIAKIIMEGCGCSEVPIYAGTNFPRTMSNASFLEACPLFPAVYGYPSPQENKKPWYIKQAQAYREHYGERFSQIKLPQETGADVIVRLAKQFSPTRKLMIIGLGPLYDLAEALQKDPSIAASIKLVSMGGLPPKGYNWLISPKVTAQVISQVETLCVTSSFVVKEGICLSSEEVENIAAQPSEFGNVLVQDWKNWLGEKFLSSPHTPLYDPTTAFLALNPWQIAYAQTLNVVFPCLDETGHIRRDFVGQSYNDPALRDQIVNVAKEGGYPVTFIESVYDPLAVKSEIFNAIQAELVSSAATPLSALSLFKIAPPDGAAACRPRL